MLFLEVVLFLAAATAVGFVLARFVLARPAPDQHVIPRELTELRIERDQLRLELDAARRAPPAQDAADVRVEHLRSAVQAAKRRIAQLEDELAEAQRAIAAATPPSGPARAEAAPPERLAAPDGPADDLKRIAGIGPGIEEKLNQIGIFHFRQVAALSEENIAWLDQRLRLRGRLERQDWVGQARALAVAREAQPTGELQPAR
ncbi:MAG TPA: hypothetical protein VFZ01_07195 [Geminicoccaceae bacterium]